MPVAAADDPDRLLWFGGFYLSPDSGRGADSGNGVALGYARRFSGQWWWELRGFTDILETDTPGATDFYQTGLGLDLLRPFLRTGGGEVFALAGAGAVYNDVTPDSLDGTSAWLNAGLGWRGRASDTWGLRPRVELRYVHDTFEDGFGDVLFGLALEIGPRRVVEKVVEQQVEVEREKIVEVVREVPVEVLPPDADGDGVPDRFDRCPDTLPGAKVGPDGCVREEQVITLPNIEFEFALARLTPVGRERLDPVVKFMQDQPEVSLDVWGHTDWVGSQVYNQPLSEGRARAVVEHLVARGIASTRLTYEGFGELRPIASNETEEGRTLNRRVELRIRATGASRPSGE